LFFKGEALTFFKLFRSKNIMIPGSFALSLSRFRDAFWLIYVMVQEKVR
jgi:hypothetical protein